MRILPILAAATLLATMACGVTRQNPQFFKNDHYTVEGPYELTALTFCQPAATGMDRIDATVKDYYGPALWKRLGADPSTVPTKVVDRRSDYCTELIHSLGDDFRLPPRVKTLLATALKKSGARGAVIPIAAPGCFANERAIVDAQGRTIASTTTGGCTASGYVTYYLFYVNDEGEVVFGSKHDGGFSCSASDCTKVLRDETDEVVADLVEGAPPIKVTASN
jgi:hypothetical protein